MGPEVSIAPLLDLVSGVRAELILWVAVKCLQLMGRGPEEFQGRRPEGFQTGGQALQVCLD